MTAGARDVTFAFIGAGPFSGNADELRFSGGILQGDSDRDGIADFEVGLTGVASLVPGDFLF